MSTPTSLPPAGWYPDPQGGSALRWWNGTAWTADTRQEGTGPADSAPAPAGYPTAPQEAPAAQQAYPGGAQQAYPGAPQGYPGAQQAYPDAPQGYPGAQQAYPGAQQAYPGAQPGYGYGAPIIPTGAWRSPVDDRPAVTGMGSAIRTVFQKYAQFDGRASRPEYWWWALFNGIIVVGVYILALLMIIPASASSYGDPNPLMPAGGVLGSLLFVALLLWGLAVVVPGLALMVRRLRDGGYHWALIFIGLVPFGSIVLIVLACMPSKYP